MKTTVKADYEQLLTNLVMAEGLLEKAKKELFYGDVGLENGKVLIDKQDYNFALEYASKFILESRIKQ